MTVFDTLLRAAPRDRAATTSATSQGGDGDASVVAPEALHRLLGGVLQAFNDAQLVADASTQYWAKASQSDPSGLARRVPRVVVEAATVDLHFAVETTALESPPPASDRVLEPTAVAAVARSVAAGAAQHIATQLTPTTASCDDAASAEADDERAEVAKNLQSPSFVSWLAERLTQRWLSEGSELIGRDGNVDLSRAATIAERALREHLLDHPDLIGLTPVAPAPVTPRLRSTSIVPPVAGTLALPDSSTSLAALRDATRPMDKPPPRLALDIVVDGARLSKLPPTSIQTMRISLRVEEQPLTDGPVDGGNHG
ncbi:MAG: hypothetical protein JNK05_36610 [Myxococcales bacterium]|nr:hypothetical protein [Myxococcales bacterium]